jgi:hypothetical protein
VGKPRRVYEQAQSTIGRAVSIFHVILRYVKKFKKYHVKKIQNYFKKWGEGVPVVFGGSRGIRGTGGLWGWGRGPHDTVQMELVCEYSS